MNANPPGFFGKVTIHGDFVTRRLPPDFLEAWDEWLQQCLYSSKQQLGAAWLNHYLTSPIWRFALAGGVLGQHAWAGVLMPSVDRVGRHFPLMIAAAGDAAAPILTWLADEKPWYDDLEGLALTSLGNDFDLEEFELALATRTALPGASEPGTSATTARAGKGWCLPIGSLDQLPQQMPALTGTIAQSLLRGHSLWWTEGSPGIQASLLVCPGMPAAASFAAMLDGSWRESGWRQP